MILNYLKTAIYQLKRNKGFTLLNLAGLALGMACALLILLWILDEVSYDNFQTSYKTLYKVEDNQTYNGITYTFDATPGPLATALKSEIPGIVRSCRINWPSHWLFTNNTKSIYADGNFVDPEFLKMFSFKFLSGDKNHALDQLNAIVITKKLASDFFNNSNPIGKIFKINNDQSYIVSGVINDIPENSSFKFDWLANFKSFEQSNSWLQQWGSNGIITYCQLSPTADYKAINSKIYNFILKKQPGAAAKIFLFPMKDWRLNNKFDNGVQHGGRIEYVRLFGLIAFLLLIIACINFMNLATARAQQRAKEVGIRKVMGAHRTSLVTQFMSESLLMAGAAALFSLLVVWLALPYFNELVDKKLYINLFDPIQLVGVISVSLICGVLAGTYPSFYLSSFNPVKILSSIRPSANSASVLIRKSLVTVQFVACVILTICTITIYQQLKHVMNRQLGYQKDQLLIVNQTAEMNRQKNALFQDLLSTGAVSNVTTSNQSLFNIGSNTPDISWPGKDESSNVLISIEDVGSNYIETVGMKLVSGRDFYNNGIPDSTHVIINESFARVIGNNALNTVIRQGNRSYQVIGILKDFVYNNMYAKPEPLIMFYQPENPSTLFIKLKKGNLLTEAVERVGEVVKKYNTEFPFEYAFADDTFNQLFKSEILIGRLSLLFASLTIFIACLGLFGLSAYTAERKTKEIGIRKVIGASTTNIVLMLSKEFLKLILLSILIACPLAWYFMFNWLQSYSYHISLSPWIFVFASLGSAIIALTTISFQAVKAAMSNPVQSIKSE